MDMSSDFTSPRVGVVIEGDLAQRLREENGRHWKLLLAIGILCTIVGAFSIFVPVVTSIAVAVLAGWALLVAGIIQLGHVLRRDLRWSWMSASSPYHWGSFLMSSSPTRRQNSSAGRREVRSSWRSGFTMGHGACSVS